MDPFGISLCKNNVLELFSCVLGRSLFSLIHLCQRGILASFVYLSRALRLSLARCDPPIIVKISRTFSGLRCRGRSSLFVTWGSSTNSLKWLAFMSLSISFFRATHLSVLCPISLWKAQFLFIYLQALSLFMGFGDLYRPRSIIAQIWSRRAVKEWLLVYYRRGPLFSTSLLFFFFGLFALLSSLLRLSLLLLLFGTSPRLFFLLATASLALHRASLESSNFTNSLAFL